MKEALKVLVLLLLVVVYVMVARQVNAKSNGGGFGGVTFAAIYPADIGVLNDRLQTLGYPQRFDVLPGVGGLGFGYSGDVVIGGTGISIIPLSVEGKFNGTNVVAKLSGSFGFFEVGYAAVKTPNFSIIPLLGIGGGGYFLTFKSKSENYDFETIAKNPYSYKNSIPYAGFGVELGLLTHGQLNIGETIVQIHENLKMKSYSSVGILIKISYIFTLVGNNDTIIEEPRFGNHTINLGLSITFGGRSEKL